MPVVRFPFRIPELVIYREQIDLTLGTAMLHWLTRALQSFPWFGRAPYEKLIRELDTGMFESTLDKAAGDVAPAAPQRYADTKPFDAQAWAASRDSQLNQERQSGS